MGRRPKESIELNRSPMGILSQSKKMELENPWELDRETE
jgi:hypothetical protein